MKTTDEFYRLWAKWGDRVQSSDDCVAQTTMFLRTLRDMHPAMSVWYRKAKSLESSLKSEVSIEGDLGESLLSGEDDSWSCDTGGFKIALWNGREGDGAISVYLKMGAESWRTWPLVNYCWIDFPTVDGVATRELTQPEFLRTVMIKTVQIWNPDWANLSTDAVTTAAYSSSDRGPYAGWLTYLTHAYGELPNLPAEFAVDQIDSLGSLISIQSAQAWSVQNLEHVDAAKRITAILRSSGLLLPMSVDEQA